VVPVAAIALEPLDLTALEPAAQSACVETMARLLCSLEVPLQFVVRRRRVAAPTLTPDGARGRVAAALDLAVRSHQSAALAAIPAFRSEVLAVMRDAGTDRSALLRHIAMAAEMLRGAGCAAGRWTSRRCSPATTRAAATGGMTSAFGSSG
jgi:hypothetical protein